MSPNSIIIIIINFIYIVSFHRYTCSRHFTLDIKILFLKIIRFRPDLNDSKDSAFLKDTGSEFHRYGPQTLKDLLPIFKLVFGTTSRLRSLDLNFRDGTYGVKRSDKYCGPKPLTAL